MKYLPHTFSCAAGVLVLSLSGCAPSPPCVPNDCRIASENFVVEFIGGDRDDSENGQFFYRVMKKEYPRQLHLVPSGFLGGDHPLFVKEHVRLIESTAGKYLLIEEDIPNDCWMHKNYLIVSAGPGTITHSYLDVPEAPHEGIPGPGGIPEAPNDPSTILWLDDEFLTFRYAKGTIERRRLDSIRRMSKPHPIG